MARESDYYSEGLGFKSQLDPRFFFSVDLFLTLSTKRHHECLLSLPVNNIKSLFLICRLELRVQLMHFVSAALVFNVSEVPQVNVS